MSSDLKTLIAEDAAKPNPAAWEGWDCAKCPMRNALCSISTRTNAAHGRGVGAYEAFHQKVQGTTGT